jgi:hypothetical protein
MALLHDDLERVVIVCELLIRLGRRRWRRPGPRSRPAGFGRLRSGGRLNRLGRWRINLEELVRLIHMRANTAEFCCKLADLVVRQVILYG